MIYVLAAPLVLVFLGFFIAALLPGGGPDPESPENVNADAAANIGDTVELRWSNITIICTDRDEASKVYVAGELTFRLAYDQHHRVQREGQEFAVRDALDEKATAKKQEMQKQYSCRWATPIDTPCSRSTPKATPNDGPERGRAQRGLRLGRQQPYSERPQRFPVARIGLAHTIWVDQRDRLAECPLCLRKPT